MPSLREIRRKIKSVKSTEQITRAMKMVAAARMRRAQAAILSARPFAREMEEVARALASAERSAGAGEGGLHPFFQTGRSGAPALVLVTADKGLCGSFNSGLIKAAAEWLKFRGGKIYIAAVGRKGRDFLHRFHGLDLEPLEELLGVFPKVSFSHAEILGKSLLEAYEGGRVSEVSVIYNEFKSVAQQKIVRRTLLPIEPLDGGEARDLAGCGFEPGRAALLDALLRRFLKAQIYRILLESQAAELAARMNAMDAASKNAAELKADLNLDLNSQRQAIITKEIAELVGGAEALAS